jgi:hypothetical protein
MKKALQPGISDVVAVPEGELFLMADNPPPFLFPHNSKFT